MYKAQINLTRTTWATYRSMYQNIITEEVEDAYATGLKMYSNPEIYTLEPILDSNFDDVCAQNNINDFKKSLIRSSCFNASNPKKFYKPVKGFFDNMIPKTSFEGFGLKLTMDPNLYEIKLEISNNPITNPLYKIFLECMENINFPNRIDNKVKGLICWNDETKEIISKVGPNPYMPQGLIKEEKAVIKTFMAKEIHEQTVTNTKDKFLF